MLKLFWVILPLIGVGVGVTTDVVAFSPTFTSTSWFRRQLSRHPVLLSSAAVPGFEMLARHVLEENLHNQIEDWVQQRAAARWQGDYARADEFRELLLNNPSLLPPGLSLVIEDIPRAKGGGSHWTLIWDVTKNHHDNVTCVAPGPTVLQLAHSALGMAVSSSQTRRDCANERQKLIDQAKARLEGWASVQDSIENGLSVLQCLDDVDKSLNVSLWLAVEQEMRGRKASDAAFWFAMAGVDNADLYEQLLRVGLKEVQRFGRRPSCRTKDLWAIVDRFAAAGVQPSGKALRTFSDLLSSKDENVHVGLDHVMARWQLHADSCALLVWKFSTRQRKQRDFLATAARHWQSQSSSTFTLVQNQPTYNWTDIFVDPKRPLVIDTGCGQGLSLLGIASMANRGEEWHAWEHCNFLGIDLSALTIGYARGVAKRWDLNDVLYFAVDSAEHALEAAASTYPGLVSQILIQFPTPYRVVPPNATSDDYQGNTQLPRTAQDGFMVSIKLLRQVASLLKVSGGRILLQSNCEDVALHMANTAKNAAGMVEVISSDPRMQMPAQTTQRTDTWLATQRDPPERASGSFWSNSPILPRTCQTETEIACGLNGTPVHRCILTGGPSLGAGN